MSENSQRESITTAWIQAFALGDTRGLNYLFDQFYPGLCFFANKLIHNEAQAKEIAADAFVKVWERRLDFDAITKVKAFLYIATKNACFNYLKSNQRRNDHQKELLYLLENNSDTIIHEEIYSEILMEINREIEELPAKCRTIFKMLFYENMSSRQVADKLDLSINTVQAQKHRAVESLRTSILKKYGDFSLGVFLWLVLYS